jgi:hypothetical protein
MFDRMPQKAASCASRPVAANDGVSPVVTENKKTAFWRFCHYVSFRMKSFLSLK